MSVRLGQFIEALGGTLEGNPDQLIARLAPLEAAGPQDLSFLSNPRYQQQLAASQAACVIVAPAMREPALQRGACIVADDPYVYFARATQWWKRQHVPAVQPGVHPSAVVHPDAVVDVSACIGPLCVVERGAHIGAHTWLKSRVSVGEDCHIGARCIVHAGAVIGADGFGFAPEKGAWVKIEQLGAVRIGDDVEIGANTCIDRGALGDTVIEDGVKLDNLVQVGHNVHIGRHSAMAGCVGIAGSARIGAHCSVGGGGIVLGHLTLADHVHVSAATTVTRSIHQPGLYTGMFPIDDNARWEKNAATVKQLHSLRERIKALEGLLQNNKIER
ncbi:UDP-3-O-(3-hydroxymyristoyl)glucosamine N-acyltransferase [Acidovorax sp. W1-6]|uniref:UDP-3-O-(3-hydroxymyristoyl)glucosamine N-acyltransferase n=1 Tax=Simplicispira sedimenti TaxID=2919500 RepID=UPI001FAA9B19